MYSSTVLHSFILFLLAVKSFKPQSEISWPWNLVQKHDGEVTSTLNVKTIWTQVLSSIMSSLFEIEHGKADCFFTMIYIWNCVRIGSIEGVLVQGSHLSTMCMHSFVHKQWICTFQCIEYDLSSYSCVWRCVYI